MEAINWDAISAISESLGLIVVVGSVLFVGFQIRFARLAAADMTRQARSQGVRDQNLAMVTDPELRKNWVASARFEPAYERLAGDLNVNIGGAVQVEFLCLNWMYLHWSQYNSINTSQDLEELEHIVSAFYSIPPMSICWNDGVYGKDFFDNRFVRFFDQCIALTD